MCETGECFLRLGLGKRWDFSFLLGIQMDNSISGKFQRLASFWGLETRKAGSLCLHCAQLGGSPFTAGGPVQCRVLGSIPGLPHWQQQHPYSHSPVKDTDPLVQPGEVRPNFHQPFITHP